MAASSKYYKKKHRRFNNELGYLLYTESLYDLDEWDNLDDTKKKHKFVNMKFKIPNSKSM